MPLVTWRRRVANPFHRGSLAFLEFPQNEIVFERICANGEVIAVGLEVEQYSGALIDAAGNAFEAHGDVTIAETGNVLGDDIGEIGISLNPIEDFGVAIALKRVRFICDPS